MQARLAHLLTLAAITLSPAFSAEPWSRQAHQVIDAEVIRAIVPRHLGQQIDADIRWAAATYRHLAADAGYQINEPLWLWLSSDSDLHNGFSTVIPSPLIQVDLAQARPEQTIFAGGADLRRTLVHELAHHISNDRNHDGRAIGERIFGRILPNDPLSLLLAYLTWPSHVTMPAFWHEGLASWAETTYADPTSAWRGRGRDSLSHMIWRLDTAADRVPHHRDWRLSHHRWPYGGRAYAYGLAYLRHLAASGQEPWQLAQRQSQRWAFRFDGENTPHRRWLPAARQALIDEQQRHLAHLQQTTVTTAQRLTPADHQLGAPAWLSDGRLVLSANGPYQRPYLAIHDGGNLHDSGLPGHATPPVRSNQHLLALTTYDHRHRARCDITTISGDRLLRVDRMSDADVRHDAGGLYLCAIDHRDRLQPRLRILHRADDGTISEQPAPPCRGRPWSPTWRPGQSDALCWVETDHHGSRLMFGHKDEQRQLISLPSRIIHPAWSADGDTIYFCADHSGVANAYALSLADNHLRPVTNTIGGVVACVPAPDGRELAIIDHDHRGPFLARISADPASWPKQVPTIDLTWPDSHPLPPHSDQPQPLTSRPYRGLSLIRPRFWTPTTLAVPSGGLGISGLASDPLFTHVLSAGLGVGPDEDEPVGLLAWTYRGWCLDVGALIHRRELTYSDEVLNQQGELDDYTETVSGGEIFIGRGIAALDRGFFAIARAGRDEHDTVGEPPIAAPAPIFTGEEHYLQLDLGYDDRHLFPDGYAADDGVAALVSYRHSGLDGELERNRLLVSGSGNIALWPAGGHQLHLSSRLGWSDGDHTYQGAFAIGGALGQNLPRGYSDRVASGDHLAAAGIAYRAPLRRPFTGFGSSPLRERQLVLELFFDAAKVSRDQPLGDNDWFRSTGFVVHSCWEFWNMLLQPGVGLAQQLDGPEDASLLVELGFRW
ncbi:MAG: hypothetical protein ACYTF0_00035 [Planctomycetota bacterium]|jgi:hypothetical protein